MRLSYTLRLTVSCGPMGGYRHRLNICIRYVILFEEIPVVMEARLRVSTLSLPKSEQVALGTARTRIGEPGQDRLRWLLDFAYASIDTYTKSKWVQLGWEIHAFAETAAHSAGQGMPLTPLMFPRGPSPINEAKTLRKQLRFGLENLFAQRDSLQGRAYWSGSWRLPIRPIQGIELTRWPEVEVVFNEEAERGWSGPPMLGHPVIDLCYRVRWPDTFWLAVAGCLTVGAAWLRACLECHSLFVRTRRQEYCGAACSQKVRTRTYRANLRKRGNRQAKRH